MSRNGQARRRGNALQPFLREANLLAELERCSRATAKAAGQVAHYVHDDDEAELYGVSPGNFTDWGPIGEGSDLLFYEGLHGAVVTAIDIAKHADLKIGVVPVINLEWTQKIHRDRAARGYTTEAVTDTILRRMHALRSLHLPAIHRDRHQLPARADRRHLESVRRALDPDRRTNRWW